MACWRALLCAAALLLLARPASPAFTELGPGSCAGDSEQGMRYWYTNDIMSPSLAERGDCEAACEAAGAAFCKGYAWKPGSTSSAWCGLYGALSEPATLLEWGLADPSGATTVTRASGVGTATCYLHGAAWVFAQVGNGRCRGPGGWSDLVNSRYRLHVADRADCEAYCVSSAAAGYGTCVGYSHGTTADPRVGFNQMCRLYGEGVNNLRAWGEPDGAIISGGWSGTYHETSAVAGGFQLADEDMECWASFIDIGAGGCAGPAGELVNARSTDSLDTRSECATVCVEFGYNCHGFAWMANEMNETACEVYGSELQGNAFSGWQGLQRDTRSIGGTFESVGFDCSVKAPSWSDYDFTFSNCAGQWADCTEACEGAGARNWQQTTPQLGAGAPCPDLSPPCTGGEGGCVTFKAIGHGQCLGSSGAEPAHRYSASIASHDECEAYCKDTGYCVGYSWVLGHEHGVLNTTCYIFGSGVDTVQESEAGWTGSNPTLHTDTSIQVTRHYLRDPPATCYVREPWGEQPAEWEPPQDCEGQWSTCTAACETAAERGWHNITEVAGWGRGCPAAEDCLSGDDDCLCTRFADSQTVEPDSCTECTSGAANDCLNATCKGGFHSYANGTCCHTGTEIRSGGGGCECVAGLRPVNAAGCGPAFACPAGMECISQWDCNSADDCIACGPGNWSESGSLCETCETGKVPNAPKSACELCPVGRVPNEMQARCRKCDEGRVPNRGQTDCEACDAGKVPQESTCVDCPAGTETSRDTPGMCACATGSHAVSGGSLDSVAHYSNVSALPAIHCWDHDRAESLNLHFERWPGRSCRPCEACLSCSPGSVKLRRGWQFLETNMSVGKDVHAFRCPIESACPEQTLTSLWDPELGARMMIAQSCPMGSNYSYDSLYN